MPSEQSAHVKNNPVVARGNVIKGYQGSGTEHDPILIENLNHLMGLQRAEVGQQGYYFRQTADIDCSEIGDSWVTIPFKGRYDGGGYRVLKQGNIFSLFSELQENSIVINLILEGLSLCNNAVSSGISGCKSTHSLIDGGFSKSAMVACSADGSLVSGAVFDNSQIQHSTAGWSIALNLKNSVVECCTSGSFLIEQDIEQSEVKNCCVDMDGTNVHYFLDRFLAGYFNHMGLVGGVISDSELENIYVQGKLLSYRLQGTRNSGYAYFSGIAAEAHSSKIRGVLIGLVEKNNSNNIDGIGYITNKVGENMVCERNAVLDSNQWGYDSTGVQTLSQALFNRYYCEHTLGWDFDTVWDWNNQENRPVLRPYQQDSSMLGTSSHSEQTPKNKQSLLQQQVMANIWL